MPGRISGKVAIITGAARGIGSASAILFAREGARVALWDTRQERGLAIAEEICKAGGCAIFSLCDVTKPEQIQRALSSCESELGLPSILFNNAGNVIVGGVEELTEEQWDFQYAVNVKTIFLVSKYTMPYIRRAGGGSIINMSSESAFVGYPMHPAYCSSKAAVLHLSRSMAMRYASENIRVNALCPGAIRTELYQEFLEKQPDPLAVEAEIIRLHPLGIGRPEDIAYAALFLASDESAYMTGAPLLIDGGITAI